MAALKAFVSRPTLLAFCIVGIAVTTLTTILRIYVRLTKQGRIHADDYACLVALTFYVTLAALYIADLPYLYGFLDWTSGQTDFAPDPALPQIYAHMMTFNFAVTALFWVVLWSVKISLLLFFKRVIQGTNWIKVWWMVFAFTVVTFIGCLVSEFTSCDSIADFTILGKCVSPKEQRVQIISLYFSFTADVVTELAIMAIPLRALFGLQISRRDKFSLACLFSVGAVAIAVSMVRVFLIWAKTKSTTPSPAWLGLWAVVECMVAIIVGCIPAISQLFRAPSRSMAARNSSNTYPKQYVTASGTSSGSRQDGKARLSHVSSTSEEHLTPNDRSYDQKPGVTVTSKREERGIEMSPMQPNQA